MTALGVHPLRYYRLRSRSPFSIQRNVMPCKRKKKKKIKCSRCSFGRARWSKQPNSRAVRFNDNGVDYIRKRHGKRKYRIDQSGISYNSHVPKLNFREFPAKGYRRIKYNRKNFVQSYSENKTFFDLLNNLEITTLFFIALFQRLKF